jgi:hypothetical protein
LRHLISFIAFVTLAFAGVGVDRSLSYPDQENPNADEIAKQVYFVNHQLFLDNQILERDGKSSVTIVRKADGKKPIVFQGDRYLNNDYNDGNIKSNDMVIFTSGKMKGTGVLVTEYVDPDRSLKMMMWLPALRKVRRMAEPAQNLGYREADVAFMEEAKLRRLSQDDYEILATRSMTFDLGMLHIEPEFQNKYTKELPEASKPLTADVYVLKATPKEDAWYDYRIDYVDTEHFTVYRTNFYVDDKIVKIVDRHWIKVKGIDDPRAYQWTYWYSVDPVTNYQTVNFIPAGIIKSNQTVNASFWSESTLQKINR